MTTVATEAGPLTTTAELPESMLFGTDQQAAIWLAFVGLRGHYAVLKGRRFWRRWNGCTWERCDTKDVHRAVRRVLGAVYDRRMAADPTPEQVMQLLRLMDLNWRLGPLMWALRPVVTADTELLL